MPRVVEASSLLITITLNPSNINKHDIAIIIRR